MVSKELFTVIIINITEIMCESKAMEVAEALETIKTMDDLMDVKKALKDLYEEQTLKILVCGKTGTGKSSLLNVLLGQQLFEIGGPGDTEHFKFGAVTQDVIPKCASMQNTLLEIFDTPGLQDGTEKDAQYLENMHKKCKNVNLVLYCIDMTITRWAEQDIMTTNLLTKKFGAGFWKKAVLVLTKANIVKPRSSGDDDKMFCKTVYDNFVKKFQAQLIEQEVPEDIARNIPTVAAGSYSDRCLPYVSKAVSDNTGQKCKDFLPELWLSCFERMSGNSRLNFLKVTDYSKRIEASRDHLQQEQKELLEKLEQDLEAKEKELQENERRLNARIAQLNIEKQREIERIRQSIQNRYVPPPPQPRVVYRTEYRSSSDDCCIL